MSLISSVTLNPSTNIQKSFSKGCEMAPKLRAPCTLLKDLGLILSTQMLAHKCWSVTLAPGYQMPCTGPYWHQIHICYKYIILGQNIHIHKLIN